MISTMRQGTEKVLGSGLAADNTKVLVAMSIMRTCSMRVYIHI